MKITQHFADNNDGWKLELKRTVDPERFDKTKRPLLIVPGYGMNSFIFGYHPTGLSMEAFFANSGIEVWSANLRNQGGSISTGGHEHNRLQDYGITDLKTVLSFIQDNTVSEADRVDAIGCSLGGTLLFIQAALVPDNTLGALVNMGGPLSWQDPNPLLKFAASFPNIWGLVRFKSTRKLAGVMLPLLLKVPMVLRGYMHKEIVDTSNVSELVKTVDDPNPHLNRQLAHWISKRDLVLDGQDLSKAVESLENPLLTVVANADGIVPEQTVLSAHHRVKSRNNDILWVGDDKLRFAHADLFISNYSQKKVFGPIANWLSQGFQ